MKRRNRSRNKSWIRGNVSIFGKSVPVIALAIALSATVGFALLTNYVTVTGMATVQQSVVLKQCHLTWDGHTDDECDEPGLEGADATWNAQASGGDTRAVGINLNNRAEGTPAMVDFVLVEGLGNAGTMLDGDVTVTLHEGYNMADEECVGLAVGMTDRTVPAGGGDTWFCLKLVWNIAADPGPYDFTLDVNP